MTTMQHLTADDLTDLMFLAKQTIPHHYTGNNHDRGFIGMGEGPSGLRDDRWRQIIERCVRGLSREAQHELCALLMVGRGEDEPECFAKAVEYAQQTDNEQGYPLAMHMTAKACFYEDLANGLNAMSVTWRREANPF
ncbi:DUF3775 domain-containing protein [Phycisphaerales bacterium AB-hyl4]|uniref:DUF3775 domain-containing protein n=1 Tax=Natronomicrosphaera hydrolytica TaxID=3242702 RepID=A0ABV4UC32_9BACT